MEKIYRVKMNSKGAPNFSTAVEVADRPQGDYNRGYCDAVQGIAEEMVKQGKCIVQDRPQGWIPCSERLPKPYTEVLVCDECGWISLGSYRPCDVTEKDSGWSTHTRIKMPTDEVVAWMPLPKPWKGADDE